MDTRVVEVLTGLACLLLFLALVVGLPAVVSGDLLGIAYLLALVVFIVALSGAGYVINERIT